MIGADQVYQKALEVPFVFIEDLSILKQGKDYKLEVTCTHDMLLLYGRYCKLSRECSQSPWCIDGKTLKDGSVEEIISTTCKDFIGAEVGTLHGSGREDIDVRMLGHGRPFVMEF